MATENIEIQRDLSDLSSNHEQNSPLSNRFLVAHSSPVHESTTDIIIRAHDDSFQSSSSASNSKSSSSTASRSSRLQYLITQRQSAVNSPLIYSRCTSVGSLSSYDIRSSCNESYTSECSSVKPSGLISPSDMPDSPPCEPEILEEDHPQTKPNNRTLTMNTTSSHNRTTMMSETVIEKTFIFNQQELISNRTGNIIDDNDDSEHLDEVIVFLCDGRDKNQNPITKLFYDEENLLDDDSCQTYNSQVIENYPLDDNNNVESESSFNVPSNENLSVITEESSFIEDINSNDENSSIKILYDLIKKPHWTNKTNAIQQQQQLINYSSKKSDNPNTSFSSSSPSSLSLDSSASNQTEDDDEYDPEKGRQLIQRLIEETLVRRSLPTDFLHSTSCVHCPSNTPMTTATRSISSSSSSSISVSTKSCTCITNKSLSKTEKPQRSQSSPARPSTMTIDESKRQTTKHKERTVNHTRSSFLRLRQAQQNKRLYQQDKKF